MRQSACTCRSPRCHEPSGILERQLGLVLFVRTTRRVELTPAGRTLLGGARRALAELDAAVADAREAGPHAE